MLVYIEGLKDEDNKVYEARNQVLFASTADKHGYGFGHNRQNILVEIQIENIRDLKPATIIEPAFLFKGDFGIW